MAQTRALPLREAPVRRLVQLFVGLVVFAVGEAMLIAAGLGVFPWDVLSQGLVRHVGLTIGTWSVIVAFAVLLLWWPLRERPGLGTVANATVIGLVLDPALRVLPHPDHLGARLAMVAGGVLVNGVASAVYIGSRLGPGPRDGLMTGLSRVTGASIRLVRTALEVTVVVVGAVLGGQLGLGTVAYALAIGPIIHATLPFVTFRPAAGTADTTGAASLDGDGHP